MTELIEKLASWNAVSALIVCVIVGSAIQGMMMRASGSAKHLLSFVSEAAITITAVFVSWKLAGLLSPKLQEWLTAQNITIPEERIGPVKQLYYSLVTSIRDFPLLRFGLIFLAGYALIKHILYWIWAFLFSWWNDVRISPHRARGGSFFSGLIGAAIGSVIGTARALLVIAVLFIYVTLFPHGPFTGYIQESALYQRGATQIIEPLSGDFIASKLPVFTRAVEEELGKILDRKYEVIDNHIPEDIAAAARTITADAKTDEEKARALYRWIGTRIRYDWEKVRLYEERNIWKEQTPEETFKTRQGVCIDYSRLYAVMARAVGLQAKVVTGLGYDGRGGYGPHAWNEVYLSERGKWVPLDSTWAASGGNWFDPPGFYQSHVKDA